MCSLVRYSSTWETPGPSPISLNGASVQDLHLCLLRDVSFHSSWTDLAIKDSKTCFIKKYWFPLGLDEDPKKKKLKKNSLGFNNSPRSARFSAKDISTFARFTLAPHFALPKTSPAGHGTLRRCQCLGTCTTATEPVANRWSRGRLKPLGWLIRCETRRNCWCLGTQKLVLICTSGTPV